MGLTPYTSPFKNHLGQLDFNHSPIPGLDLLTSALCSSRHRKIANETNVALQFFRHNTQFTTFLLQLHAYEPSMVDQVATWNKPGSHFVHVHIKDSVCFFSWKSLIKNVPISGQSTSI